MPSDTKPKLSIRFGLGAIKAVGFNMTENAVKERVENGKFKDIYDFSERLDPKTINKKSIEALSKAGAFDCLHDNRHQIANSFDVLSSYAAQKHEAASSNQMSLFCGTPEADVKPELKKVEKWTKIERLQKEFEAFGFFLNEHPTDDHVPALRRRGVIFSDKLERDELGDNSLVKMSGVIAGSKHRSGPRGRFAYLTISDYLGIFEAMIFDENFNTDFFANNAHLKNKFFILLLVVTTINFAQTARKYSNEFLNIGAGAKGLAMGGAQVASVADATAGYWNPAGLTEIKEHTVASLMHAEYFAGIGKYDYASIAMPLDDPTVVTRSLGFSLIRFAVDDIPNTLFLVEPDGSVNYNNIRSFSSADYALLVSYGQVIFSDENRTFSFGANAKVVHRSVGSFAKAWGLGIDAGLQYRTSRFNVGLMAKDVTTTFNAWNFSFTDKSCEDHEDYS